MKSHINLIGLGSVLAAVLAIGAWQPAQIQAADFGSAKGGATRLQELTQIKTQAEAEALKPGGLDCHGLLQV